MKIFSFLAGLNLCRKGQPGTPRTRSKAGRGRGWILCFQSCPRSSSPPPCSRGVWWPWLLSELASNRVTCLAEESSRWGQKEQDVAGLPREEGLRRGAVLAGRPFLPLDYMYVLVVLEPELCANPISQVDRWALKNDSSTFDSSVCIAEQRYICCYKRKRQQQNMWNIFAKKWTS